MGNKISDTQKIKAFLFELLQDGNTHSTKEIKDKILEAGIVEESKKNNIYASLYHIQKSAAGKAIGRLQDGSYYLISLNEPDENMKIDIHAESGEERPVDDTITEDKNKIYMTYDSIIRRLRALSDEIEEQLKGPSYDMSEQEFVQYKRIYKLNKDIHKILNNTK